MKLLKIDLKTGMFIEDVILESHPQITHEDENGDLTLINDPQFVSVQCKGGFYHPKWDGVKWVEGMSQAEIDVIQNAQKELTETQKMQIQLDQIMIAVLGV